MMIRKNFSLLTALLLAGMVVVGCGSEDISDLETEWTDRHQEVVAEFDEVQQLLSDKMTALQTVPVAELDSTQQDMHAAHMQTLQDFSNQLNEVNAGIQQAQEEMNSAAEAGSRADYEAAWATAQANYEAHMARLAEIESTLDAIDAEAMVGGEVATGDENAVDENADAAETDTAAAETTEM